MGLGILLAPGLWGCAPTVRTMEGWFTPSVKSEKEMGREFAQEAAKKITLVDEPEVMEYVTRLGQPIVEAAQPMSYRFRFHVIKSPLLNAFAVPGGHIYLYSGLLLRAESPAEVAGVIAHELAHVKHRHSAQMMGKGTLVSLAALAAILIARGEPAVAAGALGAATASQLSFTREFEQEADRYGLLYMHQAGYDPRGLISFFNTMVREQRLSSSRVPPYLLTHPVAPERLGQIERLIEVNRLVVDHPREEADFYRFQAILRAETGIPTQVLPILVQRVEEQPGDARRWHALGLAYVRFGWTHEALAALRKTIELDPTLALAWADLGVLLGRMGQAEEAEALFQRALALRPNHAPVLVSWGEMLLQRRQPDPAMAFFDKALALDSSLIQVHEFRARVRKEAKDEGGFHEEMASYYEKLDRADDALKHLKEALKRYGESSPQGEEVKRRMEIIRSS